VEAQGANAAAAAEVKKKISQAVKAVKDKQKFLEARQRDFADWKSKKAAHLVPCAKRCPPRVPCG
jgi:hypothetical protein